MTPEELKQQIRQIVVWKRGEQRAPHKPLLLLYALGRLVNTEHVEVRKGHTDGKKSGLLKYDVNGGFKPEVFELLQSNPSLVSELAIEILSQHFPPTVFGDILDSVGLEIQFEQAERRKRDPAFRERILIAYEYRCAICGYDLRMGSQHVALEAAHIKWHVAGGPDLETNGLALCSMHHKLFDLGAFAVSDELSLHVSQRANGTTGLSEWLMFFHGRALRKA